MTIASDTPTTDTAASGPTPEEVAAAQAVLAASTAVEPEPELPAELPAVGEDQAAATAEDETPEEGVSADGWKHPAGWEHEWIDFHGDRLGVRTPLKAALAGYELSQSGTNSQAFKAEATNRFITRHVSGDSYARMIDRLMNPDDPEYTEETIGDLIKLIAEPAVERINKEIAERAKVTR